MSYSREIARSAAVELAGPTPGESPLTTTRNVPCFSPRIFRANTLLIPAANSSSHRYLDKP